jgi:hypothetical protein
MAPKHAPISSEVATLRKALGILRGWSEANQKASDEADACGRDNDATVALTRATAQGQLAKGLERELNILEGVG